MNFANEREALFFLLGALAAGIRPALAAEWLRWWRLIPEGGRYTSRFPQPTDVNVERKFEQRTAYTTHEALVISYLGEFISEPMLREGPSQRVSRRYPDPPVDFGRLGRILSELKVEIGTMLELSRSE